MMPTLFIDTVSKRYERNRWALRELSLRMEAGVLGLVGPNGAGKTTKCASWPQISRIPRLSGPIPPWKKRTCFSRKK